MNSKNNMHRAAETVPLIDWIIEVWQKLSLRQHRGLKDKALTDRPALSLKTV